MKVGKEQLFCCKMHLVVATPDAVVLLQLT